MQRSGTFSIEKAYMADRELGKIAGTGRNGAKHLANLDGHYRLGTPISYDAFSIRDSDKLDIRRQ
jgi:hypothetical protein